MRVLSLQVDDLVGLSSRILSQGGAFCFRAQGTSMIPFINAGDLLAVHPTQADALRLGDVILYQAPGDRLFVHRVVGRRVEGGRRTLAVRGDAMSTPADWIPAEQVLGRVVLVHRGGRTLDLDRSALRLAARLWLDTVPLGPWLLGGVVRLKQLASCLLRSLER